MLVGWHANAVVCGTAGIIFCTSSRLPLPICLSVCVWSLLICRVQACGIESSMFTLTNSSGTVWNTTLVLCNAERSSAGVYTLSLNSSSTALASLSLYGEINVCGCVCVCVCVSVSVRAWEGVGVCSIGDFQPVAFDWHHHYSIELQAEIMQLCECLSFVRYLFSGVWLLKKAPTAYMASSWC